MSKLTLICPTYKRHRYLERSCKFWADRDVEVIYADGSDAPFDNACLQASNVRYLHYPVGIQKRLLALVEEVKTPYVCMMGDDELYLPFSLRLCLDFLELHPDYVACMGRAIGFSRLKDTIALRRQYPRLRDRHLSDSSSSDRLESHFSSYVPAHCYAVTRADVLRSAMQVSLSTELDVFAIFELMVEFLVAVAGKSIVLPVLCWLRSYEAPALRNTGDLSMDPRKRFYHWWCSKESELERENFCKYLSAGSCGVVDEVEVRRVFDFYVQNVYVPSSARGHSFLYWLRRISPASLRGPLRQLKEHGRMLFNSAAQSKATLQELRDQGVLIDENGLAECLTSIKQSWML